jgi:hypothetical protein
MSVRPSHPVVYSWKRGIKIDTISINLYFIDVLLTLIEKFNLKYLNTLTQFYIYYVHTYYLFAIFIGEVTLRVKR